MILLQCLEIFLAGFFPSSFGNFVITPILCTWYFAFSFDSWMTTTEKKKMEKKKMMVEEKKNKESTDEKKKKKKKKNLGQRI
jgi:amino acid permease